MTGGLDSWLEGLVSGSFASYGLGAGSNRGARLAGSRVYVVFILCLCC